MGNGEMVSPREVNHQNRSNPTKDGKKRGKDTQHFMEVKPPHPFPQIPHRNYTACQEKKSEGHHDQMKDKEYFHVIQLS
jgi:hypothetical protein